jgi:hypothetical protein
MLEDTAPAVDMAMQPAEFAELRAAVATVSQQDVHLGRVLSLLVLHLGHSHGLDPAQEDARLKAEARKTAREEEDARLEAEAKALEEKRASEDALPDATDPKAARAVARAAEDEHIKADAEARAKAREEEDRNALADPAQLASAEFAQVEAPAYAPVEAPAPAPEGEYNAS